MNADIQRINSSILIEFGNQSERCISEISAIQFWIFDPGERRAAGDLAFAQIHYHPHNESLKVENLKGHTLLFAALDKCLLPNHVSKCEALLIQPANPLPITWWIELKMSMTMRIERREGQLQTKTLGDRIQEGIEQILAAQKAIIFRTSIINDCLSRGHVGIPPSLEKLRTRSQHINNLLRDVQKKQRLTVTVGARLVLQ